MSNPARIAAAVFLLIIIAGLFFHANRILATNDEGILLDAAQHISAGSRPYVDFWAYMSPGSYWLQAAVFHIAGVSQFTGRLIVIADFALQCSLLFWITAQLASLPAAVGVLLAFIGFQIADASFLTAQHHWDSSTLALAAVAVVFRRVTKFRSAASGALLAEAAWCTPTAGLVGIAIGAWLLIDRERRRFAVPFVAAVASVSGIAVAALAFTHSLVPFVQQMFWLRSHYAVVNAMPYGSIIGGYSALFEQPHGAADLLTRALLVGCLALPAILPPAGVLAWSIALWRKKVPLELRAPVQLVLFSTVAIVLSLAPRQDMMHLAFVAVLPYALTAAAIARWAPPRACLPLTMLVLLLAAIFGSNYVRGLERTSPIATPVGKLSIENSQLVPMRQLLAMVRPGQGLFVYPYMPIHYFLTQAKNPTRFSFFSPGMGTVREETEALTELQSHPPEWVLYMKLSREEFLRVCPLGVNLDWRYELLEDWIEKNFRPANGEIRVMGYQLWQRIQPPVTAPTPALSAAR